MCKKWVLPIHSGWRVVGNVVDESYVALVQLQGQRVVILFIQQKAVVFLCRHLETQSQNTQCKLAGAHIF